jgi:hypothetical protein
MRTHVIVNRRRSLGSFQLVPASMAPVAQAALASQGADTGAIAADGTVNPSALIPMLFDTVAFKSNAGSFTTSLSGPSDPSTMQILNALQPTITLSGRAGSYTIDPLGQSGGVSSNFTTSILEVGVGLALGLGGLFLLFKGARR